MSDCCDVADIASALFLAEALSRRKPVDVPTTCAFCEEAPVAILPNGARAKYCESCLPMAVAA
jgi:hypothetical protein